MYVTLARLERAGLVRSETVGQASQPDKKVYELTAAGRDQVATWLADVSWSKVAPVEFHLKLVAAALTRAGRPGRRWWTPSGSSSCASCASCRRLRSGRAGRRPRAGC